MTSLNERNPQASLKTTTNKLTYYKVKIDAVDLSKAGQYNKDPEGEALTVDQFGVKRTIGISTYVGSGAYPQVGEQWIIDKSRGTWTFVSRMKQVKPSTSDLASVIDSLVQLGFLEYTGNTDNFGISALETSSSSVVGLEDQINLLESQINDNMAILSFAAAPMMNAVYNGGSFANSVPAIFQAAQLAGMRAGRCSSNWDDVEPNAPVGGVHTYNWAADDAYAAMLPPYNMRWIPVLGSGHPNGDTGFPAWAGDGSGDDLITDVNNFAAYCVAFCQRYGPDGEFWILNPNLPYVPVTEVEILNEPDYNPLYSTAMTDYSALWLAAYNGIKAAVPTMKVIHAGMAGSGTHYQNFLAISGVAETLGDGLNWHMYPNTPMGIASRIAGYLTTTAAFTTQPIIISEYGWSLSAMDASPQPVPDTQTQENLNFAQATAIMVNNPRMQRVTPWFSESQTGETLACLQYVPYYMKPAAINDPTLRWFNPVSTTTNYTINAGQLLIIEAPGLTVNLPGPGIATGSQVAISTNPAATGNTTIAAASGYTIVRNGASSTSTTLPAGTSIIMEFDGTSIWYVISDTASSGTPSGAAGGDLSGTYPNPTVSTIGGKTPPALTNAQTWTGPQTFSAAILANNVLAFNGSASYTSTGTIANGTSVAFVPSTVTSTISLTLANPANQVIMFVVNQGTASLTLLPTSGGSIDGQASISIPAGHAWTGWYGRNIAGGSSAWFTVGIFNGTY